jgi:serine phosphatase RsbU (regulator of sigma subunit)
LGILVTGLAILAVLWFVRLGLQPLDELRRGVLQLGSGDLAARVRVRSRNELEMLGDLLNRMADGLQQAQSDLVHKERLDREIEIAHELQSMLLPGGTIGVPGYDLESRYVSALEVSGDYYDIIPLGGERLFLVNADVSGKGVPGLVVMSMLRTALHARAHPGMQLVDVLVAANGMLRSAVKRGMFVTCHAGILDLQSGIYRYVSAGHCAPVRFGGGASDVLPAGGKPLGFFPDSVLARSLVERSTCLSEGDGLLLYTDGLVESLNRDGLALGIDPVLKLLRSESRSGRGSAKRPRAEGPTAAELVEDLVALVSAHRGELRPSDDLTMTIVRRESSPVAAGLGVQA